MKAIQDKILKSEYVDWKRFEFIQSENFKELKKPAYEKLKQSIIKNNFVESFKVWENGEKLYCLDGYHRCLILKELEADGWDVPEKFRADFIDCKDKKEAAKLVTIYSSIYANITDEGLYEFLNVQGLDFEGLKLEMDLPGLDIGRFGLGYISPDGFGEGFTLPDGDKAPFQQMTFTLADAQAEEIKEAMGAAKKSANYNQMETHGNENSNGNALYLIVSEWAEQKI